MHPGTALLLSLDDTYRMRKLTISSLLLRELGKLGFVKIFLPFRHNYTISSNLDYPKIGPISGATAGKRGGWRNLDWNWEIYPMGNAATTMDLLCDGWVAML